MNPLIRKHIALALGLAVPLAIGFSQPSWAQEADDAVAAEAVEADAAAQEQAEDSTNVGDEAAVIEEVVVTGSRRKPRSVLESSVPVDVISADTLENQGVADIGQLIRNVVPSYNVNDQPISDAATIVRPANLRGLSPDDTLVLVNGKRMHRAAVITWGGAGVSDGAQGPDISVIPAIALKQLELLRDGSAAQYGSDAIAGVMNFILKDNAEGVTFETRYGSYYKGDGDLLYFSGNVGMPFTDDGFFNASFEVGGSNPTSRSIQRTDAQALIDSGNTAVRVPAQIWGNPDVRGDIKLFFNTAFKAGENAEAYAFGNYAQKTVEGGFFFRNPNSRSGVFTSGGQRLVADLTPDGSGNCPSLAVPDLTDPAAVAADNAALAALAADPNCFSFNEMFPGGFTPQFGGNTTDISGTAGVRGEWTSTGISYDISGTLGKNRADFFINNTVNASLGPNTPVNFTPGSYEQVDKDMNLDFNYPWVVDGLYSDVNIAFGGEWREEQFATVAGDLESFEIGPLANGTYSSAFSSASNGFPGFATQTANTSDRTNYALYLDVEADVTEDLTVGGAVRFEHFSDFGGDTNEKITFRYQAFDEFAFRGSWSTGFRAPTVGQINTFNVSTQFRDGMLVNNGTIPSTNPVAVAAGGKPLNPENSVSWAFGGILQLGDLDITIDYFNIDLAGRITLSGEQTLDPSQVDALIASGVTSASNLQNFKFFTNDFNTITEGIDVVTTYSTDFLGGTLDVNSGFNWTRTRITSFTPGVIDARRRRRIQDGAPHKRGNLTLSQSYGPVHLMFRGNFYGKWFDTRDSVIEHSAITADAEISYGFLDSYNVAFGAQNVFDKTPQVSPNAGNLGSKFSTNTPFGFSGGFWYLRLRYDYL